MVLWGGGLVANDDMLLAGVSLKARVAIQVFWWIGYIG